MKSIRRYLSLFLFLTFLFSVPAYSEMDEMTENDGVKLYCLNIGKADCLILCVSGKNYLIDTGYEQNWPALREALCQLKITKLDAVFLTHTDLDHAGNLLQLSRSGIPVDHWYASSIYHEVTEKKHPIRLASVVRGQSPEWLNAGDVIRIDEKSDIAVLGPIVKNTENENNNSLVLRINTPHGSILLAGDMKEEEEASLISAKLIGHADVLKIGHHGDNNATSAALLKVVTPRAAIISTDSREEKDTPSSSVIKRLKNVGCVYTVTQDYGDALLLTLKNGIPSFSNVLWEGVPGKISGLFMTLSTEQDSVTIRNNTDSSVTLKGYRLYSTKGNELSDLPDITIPQNGSYIIAGKKSKTNADHKLDGVKQLIHKKELDVIILYDDYGRPVLYADNGR